MNEFLSKTCGECIHWRFPKNVGKEVIAKAGTTKPCMEGPPSLYVTNVNKITGQTTAFATVPTRNAFEDACGRFSQAKIDG